MLYSNNFFPLMSNCSYDLNTRASKRGILKFSTSGGNTIAAEYKSWLKTNASLSSYKEAASLQDQLNRSNMCSIHSVSMDKYL